MNDLVPHPIASVLFGLAVVAFFLWPVSEENRLAKRSAQSLSRLGIQIHSASERLLLAREKAEADRLAALKTRDREAQASDENLLPGHGARQRHARSRRDGHQRDGIVARPADAQCQDEKGKSWSCGAAAKAALRRLVRARAVVCALPATAEQKSFTTRCAVSGTDLSTWMVRQGWAKPNDPAEPALADAARAAKSERIGLWRGVE